MLTMDEILAPVAAPPPTRPYVFEALRGRLRVDILPPTKNNAAWLNLALSASMKADAAESEPAADAGFRSGCHANVDAIADSLIAGWAVQEDADGPHVARPYTPELGRDFLHRLIDLPQGLAEFLGFQAAVFKAATDEAEKAVDPTVTSGNSSGG